jgi:hypothetical protein
MNLSKILVVTAALYGGVFFLEFLTGARFYFPPRSIGRRFFFAIVPAVFAFATPVIAGGALFAGWPRWSRQERRVYGLMAAVPLLYVAAIFGWAMMFIATDQEG